MNDESDLIQLYQWDKKASFITSQYGTITYEKWIQLEAERIRSNPFRIVEIREHSEHPNYISLWVNDVGVHADDYKKRFKD